MAHYQGSSAEGSKARSLANEREKQLELFKKQQDDIKKANQVKLQDMSQWTRRALLMARVLLGWLWLSESRPPFHRSIRTAQCAS